MFDCPHNRPQARRETIRPSLVALWMLALALLLATGCALDLHIGEMDLSAQVDPAVVPPILANSPHDSEVPHGPSDL